MKNFSGSSEYGYGHNPNGTEMSYDDYLAENPQTEDDRYRETYEAAGDEEEAEYVAAEQHEHLQRAIELSKEIQAELDAMKARFLAEASRNATVNPNQQSFGQKAMGATATISKDNPPTSKQKDADESLRYIGPDGLIHYSPEGLNEK